MLELLTAKPDLSATVLILLSAVLHAFSNALVKIGNDKLAVRGLMGLATLVCVAPLLSFVPLPSGIVWFWLACAAVLHLSFQMVQIHAFEISDFSFAYPIMRGVAPLIIAMGAVFLLAEPLSGIQLIALFALCGGLVGLARERRPNVGRAKHRAVLIALSGAVLIAAYTLVDASGVRAAPNMFSYILWLFAVDGVVINVVVLGRRGPGVVSAYRAELGKGILAGLLGMVTYGLALVALRLGNTVEIAALRETSILFAVGIGLFLLKEPIGVRRGVAALVVAIAAVLLKAG